MLKLVITCIRGSKSINNEREKHNVVELSSYSEVRYNITWLIKKSCEKYNTKNMLNTASLSGHSAFLIWNR